MKQTTNNRPSHCSRHTVFGIRIVQWRDWRPRRLALGAHSIVFPTSPSCHCTTTCPTHPALLLLRPLLLHSLHLPHSCQTPPTLLSDTPYSHFIHPYTPFIHPYTPFRHPYTPFTPPALLSHPLHSFYTTTPSFQTPCTFSDTLYICYTSFKHPCTSFMQTPLHFFQAPPALLSDTPSLLSASAYIVGTWIQREEFGPHSGETLPRPHPAPASTRWRPRFAVCTEAWVKAAWSDVICRDHISAVFTLTNTWPRQAN